MSRVRFQISIRYVRIPTEPVQYDRSHRKPQYTSNLSCHGPSSRAPACILHEGVVRLGEASPPHGSHFPGAPL